ncbi:L,D-transpeptidase [Rhizobium giardinii]|jgi:lipoprotein-anchoring transpeptidase ErfK/SrfK|uniref:Lipoprotein-anchoring transpeptidase ErfK/SrfK n=1 Tax=Rhizobium giardinii TaxID=56731 RepID=A0A7W8X9P7_9HYPH|nr:L,D-transpeptidase [Rhizobium giardinii]MBB5537424.1 lipoprotein-anchoring transpeptidase ErfK/SrfK [Rhizobium giardinii]
MSLTRRGLLLSLSGLLAGCAASGPNHAANYAARPAEQFPLPAMPLERIKPELRRREVAYETRYEAGTVVIDTPARRLYYVLGDGRAMRYGIGVGREGYALAGSAYIGRKAEWPSWTPTANMIRRDPERNLRYAGGVPGGLHNPLGARAVYLYRNGHDTMFRIHGTNQPQTIGQAVSSGCIRMLNHDVIDLYERAEVGGRVIVLQA